MSTLTVVEKYGITATDDVGSTRRNLGGVTDKLMATVEGVKVMIKGDRTREAIAENLAAKLGPLLGLRVNEVKLIDCGDLLGLHKIASVHTWEEDFVKASRGRLLTGAERRSLDFFDAILDNDDRHEGNFGFVDDELFLIDHGLCAPWYDFDRKEHESKFRNAIENPESFAVVEKFVSLDEQQIIDCALYPAELEDTSGRTISDLVDNSIARILDIQEYLLEQPEFNQMGGI